MEVLAKLFGSPARVKLMRLFLMNPEDVFDKNEMGKRSKIGGDPLRKEVRLLEEIGLIAQRVVIKMFPKRSGGRKTNELEKKKIKGFGLNVSFPYLAALR